MNDFPRQSFFRTASSALTIASRISFSLTIILIPVRYRWVILARPMPPLVNDYTDFLLFAVDVAMISTLILWTSSMIISQHRLTLGPRHIWIPLAGLTFTGWISVVSSVDPLLSIYHAIRLILLFWFYLYIVNEIYSPYWVLIPVGLQVVTQAVIAVGQSIVQHSLGLQIFGEHALDPAISGISVVIAGGDRLLRAYGLSDHPNILGGCLAFGMVLWFSSYLYNPRPTPFLTALLPGFPALLVTFSRSAWLAFLGGAIFIIGGLMIRREWVSLKRIPWLCLISFFLLVPFLLAYSRFFGARLNEDNSFFTPTSERQSIGERFLLINSTMPILVKHPLFGVGLGASPRALEAAYPNFTVGYQPPHFTILDAALETGIFGGIFYLALILFPLITFFSHRELLLSNPLTLTTMALLISITIVGFFDYYTWFLVPGQLWQWLAWGLWAAALQSATKKGSLDSPVSSPLLSSSLGQA